MTTRTPETTRAEKADVDEAEDTGWEPEDGKGIEARVPTSSRAGGGLKGLWGRANERAAAADAQKGEKKEKSGRGKAIAFAALLHGLVLVVDWIMALVTATGVIPTLAAYLHRESGASRGQLTVDGTIALWAAPLLFLVLVLAAGELVLMRGMWRWAARRVQRITAAEAQPAVPAKRAGSLARKKTTNRKRSN